ncbi:ribulokinase [Tessaracoccus caeni]|uniref:ribulokinase n=1 Tax=Tessaracoccus caeni TaxID=3031239 RepID=UPI0023DC06A3|nr:ribulokinase [Tessaracoccus caeni]MDF1487922.1 ribulokinase [Tessaracoccus caeni]
MNYSVGIDFGTESGRAVVIDLKDGRIIGSAEHAYRHGVIDERLPGSDDRLPFSSALHDPDDYLEILETVVPAAVRESGVDPSQIVAFGVDSTASTPLPALDDGTPLSRLPHHRSSRHAYARLWKDHSSQPWASRLNTVWAERAPDLLARYGGTVSSEWLMPKSLQLFDEAPELFDEAGYILEVGDWLTWQLTGTLRRNASVAGYKACHQPDLGGFPDADLLEALSPGFSALLPKLAGELSYPGDAAGTLSARWQQRLGLGPITVGVSNMDAQVAVLAAGIDRPGQLLLVMGTSVCDMLVADDLRPVAGISGVVHQGMLPDSYGYEAGQAGVGDSLNWFVRRFADGDHQELIRLIQDPTQDGPKVLALEWLNGTRSPLVDPSLSGVFVGMTLDTRPHHIYLALLEGAAFGQQLIIENFRAQGLPVDEIIVCGGLGLKNPVLMQLLADATGLPVSAVESANLPATGAALHAAVAAGVFADHSQAAAQCRPKVAALYSPTPEGRADLAPRLRTYQQLFAYFGVEHPQIMHALRGV